MANILICDDEKDIVSALRIYLTGENYQVFTAENGVQAIEVVEKEEIHLVLLDIMMPVMDGLTAAKMIRASGRSDAGTIPIIAMSANAFTDDIEKSHAAGMNAHLVKPLDMEKLKETIGLFCERQEIGA